MLTGALPLGVEKWNGSLAVGNDGDDGAVRSCRRSARGGGHVMERPHPTINKCRENP